MIYLVENDGFEDDTSRRSSGAALGSALDLSDGTSSIVVLQGSCGAWAEFLPSVLVGQRSVFMLRQQPEESLDDLHQRARQRLSHADYPTHRLLWVTPPEVSDSVLDALRPKLSDFCDAQREVLLVSGDHVELVTAEPELEELGLAKAVPRPDRSSEYPGAGAPRDSLSAAECDSAQGRRHSSMEPPERSDIRWETPREEPAKLASSARDSIPPPRL